MKFFFLKTISILFILLSLSQIAQAKEAIDQIIAIVNDDVITSTELNQATETYKAQISQLQPNTNLSSSAAKEQALQQLIDKKLQLQAAARSGIKVSDSDLNKTIGQIAKQNHITTDSLYEQLGHEGMNISEYRKEIRDQLTMQKLQQQEIVSQINVGPQEIDDFIQSKAWKNNSEKLYHIEDLIVPLTETPSSTDISLAKKQANNAVKLLKEGKTLKQVKQASKESLLRTTDLGWRKVNDIPSAFLDHVVHMKKMNVTQPIQTGNGFHVLRLVSTKSANNSSAAPNRKQAEQLLLRKKFDKEIKDWISKLRSQAFITTPDNSNAKQYA